MELTRFKTSINRLKRQFLSRVALMRALLIILVFACIALSWFLLRSPLSYLRLISSSPLPSTNGRTNFLFLGIGGDGHEAPDLTDTMILLSVKTDGARPVLISLPRDFWVPSLRAKINTAYFYGKQKQGIAGGLTLAKSSVSEIINQPVHFAVVFNFSTFSRGIDLVGGLEINVPRTFDDYKYPLPGKENDPCDGDPEYSCRYEHLHFEAGPQHLDGSTALKYVRSRNSPDPEEGSDFARSRRQEQVISAFRAKLVSRSVLRHPRIYRDLYRLFSSSLLTDISPQHYFALARLALSARNQPLKNITLSEPDQLYHPPISPEHDNQWVLVPKNNDPQSLFDFVSGHLK